MPKDPTRNIDRYQIRGGHVNEFEYSQHQGEMTREEHERFERQEEERASREGETEQSPQAERVEQLMAEAREKAGKNRSRKESQKAAPKTSSRSAGNPASVAVPRRISTHSGTSPKSQRVRPCRVHCGSSIAASPGCWPS